MFIANVETDRNCEDYNAEPLSNELDPDREPCIGWKSVIDVQDSVPPVSEQHTEIERDESHNTLEEHGLESHREKSIFFVFFRDWLAIRILFNDALSHWCLLKIGSLSCGCGDTPKIDEAEDGSNENLEESIGTIIDHFVALFVGVACQSCPTQINEISVSESNDKYRGIWSENILSFR